MSQSYILTLFCENIDTIWQSIHEALWETGKVLYIGSQLERCPNTQRLHWQAFIKFNRSDKQRGTYFKKFHQAIHFETCKKERAQAIGYGTKVDTRVDGPRENGVKPLPDTKSDLNTLKEYILTDDKEGIEFKHVLRFQLERRWDGLKAFYEKDTRASLPVWLPNPWGKLLNSSLQAKKRHFWIFSRQPNLGKTFYFAKPLVKNYKCVLINGDFTYWNVKASDECLVLDEYNSAKLKYDTLNSMCDGTFTYRRIYNSGLQLIDPLILVLSNQSISDLYPHMNFLLYERFIEIELV